VTKLIAKDGAVEGVVAGSVREEAIRAEKVILDRRLCGESGDGS